MLKNIHLHVDSDETRQYALEQQAAQAISQRQRKNLNAIQRYMPHIQKYVHSSTPTSISVMCNKHGDLNFVDYQTGRVLYATDPLAEARLQVDNFSKYPLRVDLDHPSNELSSKRLYLNGVDGPVVESYRHSRPPTNRIDVLVVLGLGIGYHVEQLIRQYQINHLIIYEPEPAYLKCSISTMDWKTLLELAKKKETGIYLQIGKDGSELAANIEELALHTQVTGFYLLQHYPQLVFNQISEQLAKDDWEEFKKWIPGSKKTLPNENYLSSWPEPVDPATWSHEHLDHKRFASNLQAFRRYFPKIYQEFREYEPDKWKPLAKPSGEVNVFHKDTVTPLYGNKPQEDCIKSFEGFAERPNKDSLVLGYFGTKLKSYLHYQLVEDVQLILDQIEESKGELPDTIKSMILFGLGIGYQLPYIFDRYNVEKLFICEPNRDYFYASLFSIDWEAILQQVDNSGARIYLNIGDDGSNLINDLLGQFHAIGPYVLANTYFYQGYYNVNLVRAISELREQLQVIISMGDYFDHSRYCIAHTQWAIESSVPFLKKNASEFLTAEIKDTPVFIVGNGPSLDNLLPLIKQHEDQAIIISCGTALQSLHRNGITPDFHAEIESNRSTFDWAARIGDFAYLKKISLISCNGMHPDTCKLYKETFLAFKEGESSTVSVTELHSRHNWELLRKSYPTVTNFAVDFITAIGFQQVYLCGADMGFVDKEHHHSKSSGYYQNGTQVYDYSSLNNTSLIIPGNFRPYVHTKYEFKVSKSVLEQAISVARAEFYNLNDGAKIVGAVPLPSENLLILSTNKAKTSALQCLRKNCFEVIDLENHKALFEKRYSRVALCKELDEFSELLSESPAARKEAELLVQKQRDFLIDSFRRKSSLLYFYLTGTVNYINSALSKVLNIANDETSLQAFNAVLEAWSTRFQDIYTALAASPSHFDYISSYPGQRREQLYLENFKDKVKFEVEPSTKSALARFIFPGVTAKKDMEVAAEKKRVIKLVFVDAEGNSADEVGKLYRDADCLVVEKKATLVRLMNENINCAIVYLPGDFLTESYPVDCNDIRRIRSAAYSSFQTKSLKILLPKVNLHDSSISVSSLYDLSLFEQYQAYASPDSVWLVDKTLSPDEMFTGLGDRLSRINKLEPNHLLASNFSEADYSERKSNLQSLLQK